jgi:hypothetical protein
MSQYNVSVNTPRNEDSSPGWNDDSDRQPSPEDARLPSDIDDYGLFSPDAGQPAVPLAIPARVVQES